MLFQTSKTLDTAAASAHSAPSSPSPFLPLLFHPSDQLNSKKLGIVLSEKSLSRLLKNQKEFKKNNIFSRTEYEKFLLSNNFNAAYFENLNKRRKSMKS